MPRAILITGCSGAGKSTLLGALAREGFPTVPEPGRRIIAEERETGGLALPWVDPLAFAKRALAMAAADLSAFQRDRPGLPAFFDRGTLDAALALAHRLGEPPAIYLDGLPRYEDTVFVASPWPELFETDDDRRHDFEDACAEYERIVAALPEFGYRAVFLPRADPETRVGFVREVLSEQGGAQH